MELPLHIGLVNTTIDSAFLVWPDNSFQKIQFYSHQSLYSFQYKSGLPKFNYSIITEYWKNPTKPV
ncbi:hypothetical protein ABTL86_19645, partial [Acinetobacter baumannii]